MAPELAGIVLSALGVVLSAAVLVYAWRQEQRAPLETLPADGDDSAIAEVSMTTPAEDGRLRVQAIQSADQLALEELLNHTREDHSQWFRDTPKRNESTP